jgi:DNA repair exonuclease SbcCD ATPase subunit
MQSQWMKTTVWIVLAAILGAGCTRVTSARQDPAAKRFEGSQAGLGASGSAVELTERYAQLAEKAATLQQQNQQLTEENARLGRQTETLAAQLKQTQTELTEANNLLIEMLGELNTWKSDILGFRNEMRMTAKAQLEALLKILEVLGAGGGEAGQPSMVPEPNQPRVEAVGAVEPNRLRPGGPIR